MEIHRSKALKDVRVGGQQETDLRQIEFQRIDELFKAEIERIERCEAWKREPYNIGVETCPHRKPNASFALRDLVPDRLFAAVLENFPRQTCYVYFDDPTGKDRNEMMGMTVTFFGNTMKEEREKVPHFMAQKMGQFDQVLVASWLTSVMNNKVTDNQRIIIPKILGKILNRLGYVGPQAALFSFNIDTYHQTMLLKLETFENISGPEFLKGLKDVELSIRPDFLASKRGKHEKDETYYKDHDDYSKVSADYDPQPPLPKPVPNETSAPAPAAAAAIAKQQETPKVIPKVIPKGNKVDMKPKAYKDPEDLKRVFKQESLETATADSYDDDSDSPKPKPRQARRPYKDSGETTPRHKHHSDADSDSDKPKSKKSVKSSRQEMTKRHEERRSKKGATSSSNQKDESLRTARDDSYESDLTSDVQIPSPDFVEVQEVTQPVTQRDKKTTVERPSSPIYTNIDWASNTLPHPSAAGSSSTNPAAQNTTSVSDVAASMAQISLNTSSDQMEDALHTARDASDQNLTRKLPTSGSESDGPSSKKEMPAAATPAARSTAPVATSTAQTAVSDQQSGSAQPDTPLTRHQRKALGLDMLPQKSLSQEDREATEARRAARAAAKKAREDAKKDVPQHPTRDESSDDQKKVTAAPGTGSSSVAPNLKSISSSGSESDGPSSKKEMPAAASTAQTDSSDQSSGSAQPDTPLTRQQRKAKGLDMLPQKSLSQEDREATEARRAARAAAKKAREDAKKDVQQHPTTDESSDDQKKVTAAPGTGSSSVAPNLKSISSSGSESGGPSSKKEMPAAATPAAASTAQADSSDQSGESDQPDTPLTRQQRKAKGLDMLPQKSLSQEDREATEARRAARAAKKAQEDAKKMLEKQANPSTSVPTSTLSESEDQIQKEEQVLEKMRLKIAKQESKIEILKQKKEEKDKKNDEKDDAKKDEPSSSK